MLTFSSDPAVAETQMAAIIFYLTTFGYIDGDFDLSEKDFVRDNVQSQIDEIPERTCLPEFTGSVLIESYTVMYRDNQPSMAQIACLTPDEERVWVNSDNQDLMSAMETEEFCGRSARIDVEQRISF